METRDGQLGVPAGGEGATTTSPVTTADVAKVAAQARLRFTDEELAALTREVGAVLAMAARLQQVDTDGVEPTVHGLAAVNVLRDDVPRPSLSREDVLAGAPEEQDGYFKVPRILDES